MKSIHLLSALAISCALASAAHAETRYKSIATIKTDLQTMDWRDGKLTMGTLKGITMTSESTNPAFNGEYIQNCFIRAVRLKDSSDVMANCSLTDKDGDVQYLTAERKQGDVSSGSSGRGVITMQGGTGKFKGTSGSCEYTARYLKDNWQITESSCVMN